jgi:hypothetical protein
MSIKTLMLSFAVAAIPLAAGATGSASVAEACAGARHGGLEPTCGLDFFKKLQCKAYNRDGVTCGEVGMFEGEVGAPWGDGAGIFTCVNGCLKWLESKLPEQLPEQQQP